MKFANNFNDLFNAQSGLKSDMSVFNEFSDLDSSFEKYAKLFDCYYVLSDKRPNCYTYIIKPKSGAIAKVGKYSAAYEGFDVLGAFPTFPIRLSFFAEEDGNNSYMKVLCTKGNEKAQSIILDIDETVKDKDALFEYMRKVVLGTKFVKDIRNSLDLWENAFDKFNMYAEPDKI